MEIEAKFSIPDQDVFDQLCQLETLAGYPLQSSGIKQIRDRYLDTEERAILKGGYACRVRHKGKAKTATLKGLGGADSSGIHRRAEHEAPVDNNDPHTWPTSTARDLALKLSAGQSLSELFSLDQKRHTYLVYHDAPEGTRQVAELSLDLVKFGGDKSFTCYELEIELLNQGTSSDLETLSHELETTWHLPPETRSKFERGLALKDGKRRGEEKDKLLALTIEEKAILQTWVETGNAPQKRRAQIVLLRDEGYDTQAITAQIRTSSRQVRHWLAAFRKERLRIFPEEQVEAQDLGIRDSKIEQVESSKVVAEKALEETASTPDQTLPPILDALPELASPGLLPDDPMSEAGRKTLWFHFLRMLKHEPGTRAGEDIEELHDMRVATRRMRAALRVFGDFYEPDAIRPFNRGLRRVARTLGRVRDLDVFEEKSGHYLETLPQEARAGLDPLITAWHRQRATAREKMLAFLDGDRHQKFKRRFADFLQTEGAGARPIPQGRPTPYQVRHVAPRLIYSRYETVRAYETILDDAQIETLHALRIDCKYLRYTLEFLREVLGPEAKDVIKEIKAMQDHLGDLNDAEVAIGLLSDFLKDWDAAQTNVPLSQRRSAEGIVTYLASRHAEKHRLLTTFPEAWDKLNRTQVRRWMALSVAAL